MVFLSLITRCFNEPYLDEFANYYFSEGVDVIYFLYDTRSTIKISERLRKNPRIFISNSVNFGNGQNICVDANILYKKIKHTSEWFIFVDCDEFINTRRNAHLTIRDELKTTFKDADCIKIPWVMMSCNGREKDPRSILRGIVHRWNHDLRHPHPDNWGKGRCRYDKIEVKCIFRGAKFNKLFCHYPLKPNCSVVWVDSVKNEPAEIHSFYENLRECDIRSAFMVCNHYRIFSKESCIRKCSDSALGAYTADNIEKLWKSDYSEIVDETMKKKSMRKFS